jgi:FO synthase
MRDIAALAGRPARQRTTTYERVSAERAEAALGFDRLSGELLPMAPAT